MFGNLVGQFDAYPKLMTELVKLFQSKGCHVYIIPHSYNVNKPERNNDDMEASRDFFEALIDKADVHFVDKDLISPQVKYLISQMDFFIGTRMHANFAAIFTGTPVFGLAYSYKFKGAFEKNGIFSRTYDINNLPKSKIEDVISYVEKAYNEDVHKDRIDG
jgi:polysaccharide pyruvyl transferase WcaK-like protein